jgi:hypothetical protein
MGQKNIRTLRQYLELLGIGPDFHSFPPEHHRNILLAARPCGERDQKEGK